MNPILFFFSGRHKVLEYVLTALLFLFAAFNVFTGLGTERIRSWDEARHGVSSCEMMESGDYIVNTYNYRVDDWNVKPVLSFYNNIIGMKIFGRNIFGFRFFSALSYMIIVALTFFLLQDEAGTGAALVGAATFAVCPMNWMHSFRTGDPDATFMMFCFAAFVCLWYSVRKGWLLSLATFFLGLAFLVKSFHVGVHGFLMLVFIAFHWKRYSWRDLVLAFVTGAIPVLIWVILRVRADGWWFFQCMLERDLLGRLQDGTKSEHPYSPWYSHILSLNHFLLYIPLAVFACSLAAGFYFRGKKCFSSPRYALGRWALFYFLFIFIVFSICRVKLQWYILPALLYFPLAFGMLFHFGCNWVREELEKKSAWKLFILPLLIITGCLTWVGIGEGKAIRNIVIMEPQRDVLTAENGGEAYRGCEFYCINPEGEPEYPHQKFMLVIRFLDAKIVTKGVDEYKNASDDAFLVCTFGETKPAKLRPLAEEVAERFSLNLIRYANGEALYQR